VEGVSQAAGVVVAGEQEPEVGDGGTAARGRTLPALRGAVPDACSDPGLSAQIL
jgi:hypothetical protein